VIRRGAVLAGSGWIGAGRELAQGAGFGGCRVVLARGAGFGGCRVVLVQGEKWCQAPFFSIKFYL
jgi:hypothetical protein